jgi:hypothetical protein
MCFKTTQIKIFVAEKDISVWKILASNNAPQFLADRLGKPAVGTFASARVGDRENDPSLVQLYVSGNTYKDYNVFTDVELSLSFNGMTSARVSRGFHSYKNFPGAAKRWGEGVIRDFIIPKGTHYMAGIDYCGFDVYISEAIQAGVWK